MRHGNGQGQGNGNNNRRNRNRNNNGGGHNNHRRGNNNNGGAPSRNQVFDSNGPDVRIRGTANQIVEKYSALAKDATSSGDRSLAENYLQHAEHYQRMIVTWDAETRERNERNEANNAEKPATQEVSEENTEKAAEKAKPRRTRKKVEAADEDLGLPASILTEAPVGKKETV